MPFAKAGDVRRSHIVLGLLLFGLLAETLLGDTFKLTTGDTVTGDLLPTTANDQGVQVKTGEGQYERIPWASLSQDDLKKLAQIPRLEQYVDPFIEITAEEKLQRTQVPIKVPPRLERPPRHSLLGSMFSSGLGMIIILVLYVANIYAGYEVAFFRGRPFSVVCGVSAALPVVGPVLFLALPPPSAQKAEFDDASSSTPPPTRPTPTLSAAASGVPVPKTATAAPRYSAPPSTQSINPMQGEGVRPPAGLHIAHHETEPRPPPPPPPQTTTYQRGQFTFNRRFFETKFPDFFGVTRRQSEQGMDLVIKSHRGEYVGQKITRIGASELHLHVQKGPASEEVMIPFQEIMEIKLRPRGEA